MPRLAPPQSRTCGTTASGSSRNGFAMPIYYPRLLCCRRFLGTVVPTVFHKRGSIPRCASFLLTGSRRYGSPPFKRYYWRTTTSDSPSLALRLSLHARLSGWSSCVRSRWRDNRRHRAGHLISRYALRPALFAGKLPDLPSSHETLAPGGQ